MTTPAANGLLQNKSKCIASILELHLVLQLAIKSRVELSNQNISKSTFYPSALLAGGVFSSQSGQAGGLEGGCQTWQTQVSVTVWGIFFIWSSFELTTPVLVHCLGHLPICPIWAPKTCQIWHKLGLDILDCISLKLLDGFTPFKVSWTCLDLLLCNVIVIFPFAPYGFAHGPKTRQIRQHMGQTLRNPYLWNHLMDLHHSKFYGIV